MLLGVQSCSLKPHFSNFRVFSWCVNFVVHQNLWECLVQTQFLWVAPAPLAWHPAGSTDCKVRWSGSSLRDSVMVRQGCEPQLPFGFSRVRYRDVAFSGWGGAIWTAICNYPNSLPIKINHDITFFVCLWSGLQSNSGDRWVCFLGIQLRAVHVPGGHNTALFPACAHAHTQT